MGVDFVMLEIGESAERLNDLNSSVKSSKYMRLGHVSAPDLPYNKVGAGVVALIWQSGPFAKDRLPIQIRSTPYIMRVEEIKTDRFWKKVEKKNNDCWNWKASTRAGYGAFKVNGRVESAHRISYLLHYGEEASNLVLHKCDNKKCVNPNHLYDGTYSDNIQDRIKRQNYKPSEHAASGESHPDSKLTEKQIRKIRKEYKSSDKTQQDLADKYPVCRRQISDIVNENVWVVD